MRNYSTFSVGALLLDFHLPANISGERRSTPSGHDKALFMTEEEFDLLRPRELRAYEIEPFPAYVIRAKKVLPNFPECVIEQWPYRHFENFKCDYAWMGFKGFRFSKENWHKDKIVSEIGSNIMLQDWGENLHNGTSGSSRATSLAKSMLKNGTWPRPIIALRNDNGFSMPNGLALAKPYHLIEGHTRFSYLCAMVLAHANDVLDTHELWIADADEKMVRSRW